jgi:hypothetical protein
MDISSKVKNSRWVSNLVFGVLCEVDGRHDDLVLLEEVADREAEARVADTLVLLWRWWCLGQGEKVAEGIAFGDLLLMGSVLPCDYDENDTARFVDLYREGMM